jgi:homocysteine S-methyltransferase
VLDSALWSARLLIEAPDDVRAVHLAYLSAGADCITSASYQASFEGFAAAGVAESEAAELMRRSSDLALEARDDFRSHRQNVSDRPHPLVAASVGPYGAYLADGSEYDGRYGADARVLDGFHRRRFGILASSGVDLLACETIPSLAEAEVLLRILDDHPSTWAWLSFSCRNGERLWDGSIFEDAVRLCVGHDRVAAVGVNCSEPSFMAELMGRARAISDLPLIAYPNSGEAYDAVAKRWAGSAPRNAWLQGVRGSLDAGARILGGCCRIGPDQISELRRKITCGDWSLDSTA